MAILTRVFNSDEHRALIPVFSMKYLSLLVEGMIDEAVGRRFAERFNFQIVAVYGQRGFGYIRKKIGAYNRSARVIPILTLLDLMDTGEDCAPSVLEAWLPRSSEKMLFRIVVREIESWLLADRRNIAKFLVVDPSWIPRDPESEDDPKQKLVHLARRSRSSTLRRLLVPPEGSTAQEGPAYNSEMQRFVRKHWDFEEARKVSPSLDRCLRAVERLARMEGSEEFSP